MDIRYKVKNFLREVRSFLLKNNLSWIYNLMLPVYFFLRDRFSILFKSRKTKKVGNFNSEDSREKELSAIYGEIKALRVDVDNIVFSIEKLVISILKANDKN